MAPLVALSALATAGAVLAVAAALQPPPTRVAALGELRGPNGGSARIESGSGGVGEAAGRTAEALGRRLRQAAGRPRSPADDRRWGWSAIGAVVLGPFSMPLAVGALGAPFALAGLARRRQRRSRHAAVLSALPEAVDLLRVGVEAGLNPPLALAEAAPRLGSPLGPELCSVVREIEVGRPLAEAIAALPARLGEPVRPLAAVLAAALSDGAPLGPALERLAGEVRQDRRRRAEEAARRLPVKLLFPLVCCALPAFGLLTIVPLVAAALSSLRL